MVHNNMSLTAKGKAKAVESPHVQESDEEVSTSSDSSESDSQYESASEFEEEITPEYLEQLLEKAREAARAKPQGDITNESHSAEDEVLVLEQEKADEPLPLLDPGPSLPKPYIILPGSRPSAPQLKDPDTEKVLSSTAAMPGPSKPPPPPELSASGKPLTKRERKELKKSTAGKDWFDLPAPAAADLPRLYREVEALRLRNTLDPKRFYRKEEGEGKGIKGLPKHFAIGTILPTTTPFGTVSSDNLTRAERKRTLVDELVDDAEAKRYAKKKFADLQHVRGERGRGTLAKKKAARRGKW